MNRRQFLTSAAMVPLLSGSRSRHTFENGAAQTIRRVRPGDPSWPGAASWAQLRDDVGGNLIEVRSLFGECPASPRGAACLEALEHMRNPYWIGDQPAGTEVSGWLDAWTPAPSAYAVRARHAADVAAAVNFAREHQLRLVVKGGGHSYLGTSNAPDSLLVWTRGMNAVTVHDAFVPQGCEGRVAPVAAVSAEAGAVWMDLYTAVTTERGRYVQGGGCTTVGVAGLVQSGGFGSFSKRFGTAAAWLLEAEVVTADGRVRVVNPCRDPDLFWALKGGGGGTFGTVTRLTLRTHDLPSRFGGAGGTIDARSDDAFRRLIAHFLDVYRERLFNPHWGEQVRFGPGNQLEISMVCQGLDQAQASAAWQPFFDWVRATPGDFAAPSLRVGVGDARDWWEVKGNPSMIPDTRRGARPNRGWWRGDQDQVGAFIHGYESVWLPAALLLPSDQRRLAAALFDASRSKEVELHMNKGLAGAPPDVLGMARQTATNPAALDAFALAIIADGEAPAYPGLARVAVDLAAARRNAREIDRAAAALRGLVPNAGSYVSESNYFNTSWQSAYWGSHYSRLRAVKRQYDPDGLFIVHHGVGSEEWSADGFTRVGGGGDAPVQ
jgi:FAD/FMN-containing dehydrogenase